MSDSKRSKITDEHRREAAALKALWDDGRPRRTQTEFGEAYGLGIQANVGHYLMARSPLNIRAALSFAKELNCKVSEFSPRVAAEIDQLLPLLPTQMSVQAGTELERQLLQMFRELPPESQTVALTMMNGIHNIALPVKSAAFPFPDKPLPPPSETPRTAAPSPVKEKAPKRTTKKASESHSH